MKFPNSSLLFIFLAGAAFAQEVPPMPSAVLMPTPKVYFTNNNGAPCGGCKLWSYAAGLSTLQDTYTDSTAGPKNTNPIVLDSYGRASVWLAGLSYKFVLEQAPFTGGGGHGTVLWTVDNVSDTTFYYIEHLKFVSDSQLLSFTPDGTPVGSVTRTVRSKLSEALSVKDFGAKGDGSTDDTAAIVAAASAVNAIGKPVTLFFPDGTYVINPLATSHDYGVHITADDVEVRCDGAQIILDQSHDYPVDGAVGSGNRWYWDLFHFNSSRSSIHGCKFDGTGAHYELTPNGSFYPSFAQFMKPAGSDRGDSNSMYDNTALNLVGWGLQAAYQTNFSATNNVVSQSAGIGFGGDVIGGVITGNRSTNATDAHYYANGLAGKPNRNILIANNLASGNINGSGIDVTASQYVTVTGNTVTANQNWCILVDKIGGPYSATQTDPSLHVLLKGNVCILNGIYQGWANNAEIAIGDDESSVVTPDSTASDVMVEGNYIWTQNTQGTGITTSWGSGHVTIQNNFIKGCAAIGCDATKIYRIHDRAATYLKITGNTSDETYTNVVRLGGSGPYEVWGNGMAVQNVGGGTLTPFPATGATFDGDVTITAGVLHIPALSGINALGNIVGRGFTAQSINIGDVSAVGSGGTPVMNIENGSPGQDATKLRWAYGLCDAEGTYPSGANLCFWSYDNSGSGASAINVFKLNRNLPGITLTCAAGKALQGATITNGIVTAGTCAP